MKNGEGYSVPTEGEAIRRASFLPDAVWRVIKTLKSVCWLIRFEITYIELKDMDNGNEYSYGELRKWR